MPAPERDRATDRSPNPDPRPAERSGARSAPTPMAVSPHAAAVSGADQIPRRRRGRTRRPVRLLSRGRFRPRVGLLEQRAMLSWSQVNIDSYVNSNLQNYTHGSDYPIGGTSLTVGGVAFTLANYPGGGTGVIQTPYQLSPSSFDVPVNVANPTTVYTLINSTWGIDGDTVGAVEFKATGGLDYTVNLIEGQDIRNHCNCGYNQIIGQGALGGTYLGTAYFGGDQVRFDELGFTLPSSFQSSTLTDIILHGNNDYPNGNPFLAAATVASNATPIASPVGPIGAIAPTRTVLTARPRPANLGRPVTLTATVRDLKRGGPTPSGSVTFLDGTVTLDTVPLRHGVARFKTSSLPLGPNEIQADYTPSQGFAPSAAAIIEDVRAHRPGSRVAPAAETGSRAVTSTSMAIRVGGVTAASGYPAGMRPWHHFRS